MSETLSHSKTPHDSTIKQVVSNFIEFSGVSSESVGEAVIAIAETFDFKDEVEMLRICPDDTKESIIAAATQQIVDIEVTIAASESLFGPGVDTRSVLNKDLERMQAFLEWIQVAL